ncbi:hypothetical protein NQ317_002898 [Molorchus minor]|uniref:MADF domain-containing protein n=1 Tax=Molorchus minor TaxID=1323400 RepID=A0ABQ9JJ39_9CUCU|nr:hypothetical protein NQ317_002898 [Molorchus minor]
MAVAVNMWNEEKTEQLIQLYKQYPLLTVVDINAVEVERKLNILITQFRRTHRKVLNLKKSGFKAEDVEKNVWYGYKSLLFLKDRFTHSALFRNSLSKGQNEQQKKPDLPPLQPKLQPATTVPAGTILRTGFQQAGRPNIVSGTHMNEPLLFMNSIPVKRPAEREKRRI